MKNPTFEDLAKCCRKPTEQEFKEYEERQHHCEARAIHSNWQYCPYCGKKLNVA